MGWGAPMNEPQGPTPNPYDPTQFAPMHRPMMPTPGGPVPPPWQTHAPSGPPPRPPRPSRGLLWALLAAVCVLAVVSVVLTVVLVGRGEQSDTSRSTVNSTGNHPPSTTASDGTAPVPVSALDGLLPSKDVIRAAAGDPGLDVVNKGDSMFSSVVAEPTCQGINFIAAGPVYAGSGWTTVRWQIWNSPAEPAPAQLVHTLLTSVVSYPSAQAARAFYDKQGSAWRSCSGRTVNMRITNMENPTDAFWTVGTVTDTDGVLNTTEISEGGGGWSCQLTTTARNNVVTQVNICGETTPVTAAQKILDSIREKVDAAA